MRLHASASSSAMAWAVTLAICRFFFRGTSPRHGGKLAVNGPCQIGGRGAGSLQGGCGFGHERVESFNVFAGASQAASHMPYPAVAPMSPAPRTSMFRMASQSALNDVIVAVSKRWGNTCWSMTCRRSASSSQIVRYAFPSMFTSLVSLSDIFMSHTRRVEGMSRGGQCGERGFCCGGAVSVGDGNFLHQSGGRSAVCPVGV